VSSVARDEVRRVNRKVVAGTVGDRDEDRDSLERWIDDRRIRPRPGSSQYERRLTASDGDERDDRSD